MKKILFILLMMTASHQLFAQEAYMGEIRLFTGNFEPSGWYFCDGRTLSITQNQALFAIIGTTYGGNGTSTFCLPDLRGRVPVQQGSAPGLKTYLLGEVGGTESNTLTTAQLPAHTHVITVTQQVLANEGNSDDPTGRYPASAGKNSYTNAPDATSALLTGTSSPTGSNAPVNNVQPYVGLNYIICVQGIFPSRW